MGKRKAMPEVGFLANEGAHYQLLGETWFLLRFTLPPSSPLVLIDEKKIQRPVGYPTASPSLWRRNRPAPCWCPTARGAGHGLWSQRPAGSPAVFSSRWASPGGGGRVAAGGGALPRAGPNPGCERPAHGAGHGSHRNPGRCGAASAGAALAQRRHGPFCLA